MSISAKTEKRLKRDNPRTLTGAGYNALRDDLDVYGDLSGVVYNLETGATIGGNQRSRVFDIAECTFDITHTNETPDAQGTVKQGFVIWRGNRYGYREVRWDKRKEDAACLIANNNAGDWDWNALSAYEPEILELARMDASLLKRFETDASNLRAMLEAANEIDPRREWEGMPEFSEDDKLGKGVLVRFVNDSDKQEFFSVIGQVFTDKTKSIWFPKRPDEYSDQLGEKRRLVYTSES